MYPNHRKHGAPKDRPGRVEKSRDGGVPAFSQPMV